MFRKIRIALLLFILFIVAVSTWLSRVRATDWSRTQWLVVYPINGDGHTATQEYIHSLSAATYRPVEEFLTREARHYGLANEQPIEIHLAPQVDAVPPAPPQERRGLAVVWWSLRLRYWVLRHDTFDGPGNMKMYVIYHDPQTTRQVQHSLGLEKGLVGVVNAYADPGMAETNNVVIAHEFLHLVGATDKYDLATDQPVFPQGYAEPERQPLYPQQFAEIMGGRIPLSASKAEMPRHLLGVLVGPQTAREIRWIR